MKKLLFGAFLLSFLLFACKGTKEASSASSSSELLETWIISNQKAPCSEGSETQCLQVKKAGSGEYEMFGEEIVGFVYEAGYKYQIDVKISNSKKLGLQYILVKENFKVSAQ